MTDNSKDARARRESMEIRQYNDGSLTVIAPWIPSEFQYGYWIRASNAMMDAAARKVDSRFRKEWQGEWDFHTNSFEHGAVLRHYRIPND